MLTLFHPVRGTPHSIMLPLVFIVECGIACFLCAMCVFEALILTEINILFSYATLLVSHIYEPKYICDQNWVKFPSLVFEIWCSQSI